ncbi:MAG: HEAT repeat domain-containing protein, partial [Planctomycetia bacterium]
MHRIVGLVLLGLSATAAPAAEVRVLVDALTSTDATERSVALGELAILGPEAGGAAPAVARLLEDADPSIRAEALAALESMNSAAVPAVPVLVELLKKPSPTTKYAAAEALALLGPASLVAVPDLETVAAGSDVQSSIAALGALLAIQPAGVTVNDDQLARLMDAVKSGKRKLRLEALVVVARLGPKAKGAETVVLPLLSQDKDPLVRAAAAVAASALGVEDDRTAAEFAKAFAAGDPQVKCTLCEALATNGAVGTKAVSFLTKALDDPAMEVRSSALAALSLAAGETPSLTRRILDRLDAVEPADAELALRRLAGYGEAIVPHVAAALKDKKTRRWAAILSGSIGPGAAEAVPALIAAASDADPVVRSEVLSALGRIGAPAVAALSLAVGEL